MKMTKKQLLKEVKKYKGISEVYRNAEERMMNNIKEERENVIIATDKIKILTIKNKELELIIEKYKGNNDYYFDKEETEINMFDIFYKSAKVFYETDDDILVLKEGLENALILSAKELDGETSMRPLLSLNHSLTEAINKKYGINNKKHQQMKTDYDKRAGDFERYKEHYYKTQVQENG